MDFDDFMVTTARGFEDLVESVSENISRRRLLDLQNPLERLSDAEFKERYRFTKQGFHEFLSLVQDGFMKPSKGQSLPVLHKILVFIRFVSSGSFQLLTGDLEGIKQPTVSKVVKQVAHVIAGKIGLFVQWPQTRLEHRKEDFFAIGGFPGVIGAIDCTHVRIQSPGGEHAERYRNRKGYFSINCQAVCDANLVFTNIYARWFGSAHDARIFDNSHLSAYLESLPNPPGFLLGDQGYPLTPYLMTPIRIPTSQGEANFNRAHKKTRLVVERAFGILKRVFSCLKTGLRLKIETTLDVIPSCVGMYNFLRLRRLIDAETVVEDDNSDDPPPARHHNYARASAVRNQLVQAHFSN